MKIFKNTITIILILSFIIVSGYSFAEKKINNKATKAVKKTNLQNNLNLNSLLAHKIKLSNKQLDDTRMAVESSNLSKAHKKTIHASLNIMRKSLGFSQDDYRDIITDDREPTFLQDIKTKLPDDKAPSEGLESALYNYMNFDPLTFQQATAVQSLIITVHHGK